MSLDLKGLKINRVAIHTIKKRGPDKKSQQPKYAESVISLPDGAAEVFETRITESLGKSSHGVEVAIVADDDNSFIAIASKLMHAQSDAEYLKKSRLLADNLSFAQENKDLSASKLLVVSGVTGAAQNKYLVAIKAEHQDGFAEHEDGIRHLRELFLTPSQKLFKIGFFVEEVSYDLSAQGLVKDNYKAYLFDHLMNELASRSAAYYFYNQFLGVDLIASEKKLTKDFYDLTVSFVNNSSVSQDEKIEMLEALRVELRGNSAIIHAKSFATSNFREELVSTYLNYMKEQGFTSTAVTKNTEFIASMLKRKQKISFKNGVEVSAPSGQLHALTKIEEATADYTLIRINAVIQKQE